MDNAWATPCFSTAYLEPLTF